MTPHTHTYVAFHPVEFETQNWSARFAMASANLDHDIDAHRGDPPAAPGVIQARMRDLWPVDPSRITRRP